MPDITDHNESDKTQVLSKRRQWLWFIGLYMAGLLVTAGVVYFFRGLIALAS